ncbi:MAG: hypothetical protein Q8O61_06570 [Nocardioides sp.]|nr:hypothetical protein [Nocardioides sp.]
MRTPLSLVALLLVAGGLTGCSDFEIHEAICSEGEEPTWAVTNTAGSVCVRDGEPPLEGFARYPRGRVPVWINPPADYPHRTPDGDDLYYVNPNDPHYPWWDEVLAENPELACIGASRPLTEIRMEPRSRTAPKVTVLLNSVGNRCLRFEWSPDAGAVVSSELTVQERPNGPVWERHGADAAAARRLLRVASDRCLQVTASLELEDADGTPTTYQLTQARVRNTCNTF